MLNFFIFTEKRTTLPARVGCMICTKRELLLLQFLSSKVSQGIFLKKNCCRIGDGGGRGVAVIGAIPVERARIKLPPSGDQTELYFLPFLPRFTFVPISVTTIRLITLPNCFIHYP